MLLVVDSCRRLCWFCSIVFVVDGVVFGGGVLLMVLLVVVVVLLMVSVLVFRLWVNWYATLLAVLLLVVLRMPAVVGAGVGVVGC